MAYLIVSSAIFGFGLGGVATMLWPMSGVATEKLLASASAGFAVLVVFLIPVIKLLPANFDDIPEHPVKQLLAFGTLYVCIMAPFFASGLVVSTIVTRYAERIHRLYFWDLFGAGIGCLGIFVLPSLVGAEETLLVIGAAGAISAALFAFRGSLLRRSCLAGAACLIVLTATFPNRIEFDSLTVKRNVKLSARNESLEFSHWDPISKIDILRTGVPFKKRLAYDGGSQSTALIEFNGDVNWLREHYFETSNGESRFNSGKYVALSHWLKRDRSPRTLVIGSGGGQETLAALAWGASHIDAVEMVCTVINAVTGPYGDYVGHIFTKPNVSVRCDEGRSFLRQSNRQYDIIQIHSNTTTSSLATGSRGAAPAYLQTVEAYKEFFSHLTPDGVLQVNNLIFSRMITTAGRAWSELFPGDDFKRHVVVTSGYTSGRGTMPTVLVKRSPWTRDDIAAIRFFLSPALPDIRPYYVIFAAGEPEERNVPVDFFQVPLEPRFEANLPYRVFPPTDDRPFFFDLRKHIRRLETDSAGYLPADLVFVLNESLKKFVPMESAHLYFLGGLSVVVASIVILAPLLWSKRGRLRGPEAIPTLVYFSCLGAGFVIVELVLMSKFVLLIGFPIYAMATVLFTLLFSAGIGSFLSARLSRAWGRRAILVIPAFAVVILSLVAAFPHLRDLTLGMSQVTRILLVAAFLVPVGLPLGMPFPLGIAALSSKSPSLIPWAWGINGFMTVVGSLLSVILSMKFGFDVTLCIAVAIYMIAAASFLPLSRVNPVPVTAAPRATVLKD